MDDLGVNHCYFLFDPGAEADYDDAKTTCDRIDPSATLSVVDSQEKLDHIVDSGILDQFGLVKTQNEYNEAIQ